MTPRWELFPARAGWMRDREPSLEAEELELKLEHWQFGREGGCCSRTTRRTSWTTRWPSPFRGGVRARGPSSFASRDAEDEREGEEEDRGLCGSLEVAEVRRAATMDRSALHPFSRLARELTGCSNWPIPPSFFPNFFHTSSCSAPGAPPIPLVASW